MRLTYQANPTLDEVSFSQGPALRGWLQLQQAEIVRGAVGINQSPAMVDGSSHQIIVTGSLPRVSSNFKSSTDNPFLDLDWRLVDFRIDQIALEDGVYNNVILNGQGTPDSSIIHINADDISGEFSFHRGEYPDIDIASIRFPASQTEEVDPLADVDLAFLRPSDVSITKVVVGEENYGSWNFKLRRNGSGWRFADLVADIKGVHIESPEGVIWREPHGKEEKSMFSGKLSASNLAEVLPQWGYAPSVESKTMELVTSLDWPGSPLAIAMTTIAGPASLKVNHGSFLDVDSANNILRIFSLINFTAIVKRIALDFSDVFGKGISFDSITADVAFKEGILTFQSPMEVQGTGSRFRVNGTVNLATGALNNDMIVTLPVNRSLPWYAGFLALANPLAGAGVLVGERIFRNQLELFSSAKYSVAGTWDNPEVNLVSIFTKDMKVGNTDGTKNGKPMGKKKQVIKKGGTTNNREKIPVEDKTDGNR